MYVRNLLFTKLVWSLRWNTICFAKHKVPMKWTFGEHETLAIFMDELTPQKYLAHKIVYEIYHTGPCQLHVYTCTCMYIM